MTVATPPRRTDTEHDRDLEQRVADLELLIEEARRRTRRRRRKYGAIALLATLVGVATFVVFEPFRFRLAGGCAGEPAIGCLNTRLLPGWHQRLRPRLRLRSPCAGHRLRATSGDGLDHGGRVYKTTDAGKHWRSTTAAPTGHVSTRSPPTRSIPTRSTPVPESAVFKTVNGGQSWQGASPGLFLGPPSIGPARPTDAAMDG